jgi:hypothetical protein
MLRPHIQPFDLTTVREFRQRTQSDASNSSVRYSRQPNPSSVAKVNSLELVFCISCDNACRFVILLDDFPSGITFFEWDAAHGNLIRWMFRHWRHYPEASFKAFLSASFRQNSARNSSILAAVWIRLHGGAQTCLGSQPLSRKNRKTRSVAK